METIIDNGYSCADYDADNNIIISQFVGVEDLKKEEESLLAQRDFGVGHSVKGIVADVSGMAGKLSMLDNWADKEFFPPLIARGLLCEAVVVSKDEYMHFATNDIMKKHGDFEVHAFDNLQKAKQWVMNKVHN